MNAELHEHQQQLMAYLLGQDDDIAKHIVDQGGINTDVRLAIYRNAYRSRLRETICEQEICQLS
ncbi:MAG: putative DNA-binding domain-containing protein [Pseudomonadales bacterium]